MKLLRLSLLVTLLAGSALIATAGPGPQYWARPAKPKPATKAAITTTTPTATTPTSACTTCNCGKKG